MDSADEGHRVKRFKHQSYNQSLKEVHLPAAHNQSLLDGDIADNESHFHEALEHWRQLNLSLGFLQYAKKADSLSASMPLLLHNWKEIVELWLEALKLSDDEGLKALLDLLQKLAHDLRTTLSPAYPNLLDRLLQLLPRSISAPALSVLLETFSCLFKFLLVPSVHLQLLEKTWAAIRDVLPRCLPEVQRAMAEVWGLVLRRLKTASREKAIALLAEGVEGVEDASAWAIVFACKSVSQTLHTAAPLIMTQLLACHLSGAAPELTYTLLRRVLTALIHHVKNADQFSPLSDILVDELVKVSKSTEPTSVERLRRMVDILYVPTAVRQGSRITQLNLTTLFRQLEEITVTLELEDALMKFTTSILMASEMPLWLGMGRKFIQRLWEDPATVRFALKLNACLAELSWGGWKLVALPLLLRMSMSPGVLAQEPQRVLELLAALKRSKKLGVADVDLVWRGKLQKWSLERLKVWDRAGDDAAAELNDILSLSALFPSAIAPAIVDIIKQMLVLPGVAKEDYQSSVSNSAWVLGICMRTLTQLPPSDWSDLVDLISWTTICVEKYAWSHGVLEGLFALLEISSAESAIISLDTIYPALQPHLLSHSRPLRLSVLRLLGSKAIQRQSGVHDILRRCLQGEEVSLDVQGVRERVLRIGRIEQVLRDGDETGADICARWLTAQLKVNLRPLWSPAAGALASLSQRYGDLIWRLLFDELKTLGEDVRLDGVPQWLGHNNGDVGDAIGQPEAEHSWRDPTAHKFRVVFAKWLTGRVSKAEVIQMQTSTERFDHHSYEQQLLSAFGECPALPEKHNRELVPYFISLAGPNAASKLPKQKLTAWLNLFAKFSNPKALYSTDTLHALYISLLSHPDRTLQTVSLSCVFTYKSPHLTPHEEKIRILLDDTRWRDEIMSMDFANVNPQDRREFVDVSIRLLFGLMLEKRGRTRGADRRAAVLSALGGCTDEELGLLVDLMLRPLHSDSLARQGTPFFVSSVDSNVSERQQTGFLTLLGDVLRNLGPRLVRYWPALLASTIDLVANAQRRVDGLAHSNDELAEGDDLPDGEESDEEGDHATPSSKVLRSIRQLGLKRFADFFRSPVSFDYEPFLSASFAAFVSPRLSSLDTENTQAPSGLLELFYAWSVEDKYVRSLVSYDARVLPKVYGCLVATSVKPPVILRVFDIVDRLLIHSAADTTICEEVIKPHVSLLLSNISILVEQSKGMSAAVTTPIGQRQIRILSEIAQYCTDAAQASTLLKLFAPLLKRPNKLIPEKIKVDLLKVIKNLLPLISDLANPDSEVYQTTYELLSQLFQSLRSRPARLELVGVFQNLAMIAGTLQNLAGLLESLNAYSSKRMDEPDFDTRLAAFSTLNETSYLSLTPAAWLPLLYNSLHFIQDAAELAVRNNASFSMKHFIDQVAAHPESKYEDIFVRVLFPGIKNGLRSKNEMVRAEVLGVLAYAVDKCGHMSALQEMKPLLADGDDEANFFNNVLHIQIHRRSRALRRLANHCDEGCLRSNTLAEIFVPLIGNYIMTTSAVDHHLVNDAILTTGRMAKHLTWGAYHALVQRYLKLSRAKDESERVYIRTLVALLENFHFPMEEVIPENEDTLQDADDTNPDVSERQEVSIAPPKFQKSISRIVDAVDLKLLPNLLNHLEKHDANTDDNTRIPISIGIVTVAKHLPSSTREPQITRLLTILSQILRSKSQETRDLARDALNRIAVSLGPSYIPLILRELRGALLRGPQLHVLAYVAHSLLVHVTTGDHAEAFGTLDECVNDISFISAEVIFGESGKDVEAEDFKTKMREVRSSSSKGLDSFAIIAKYITPPKISSLLVPLRSIMETTETIKVMNLVEEVLKRISGGLNSNKHLVPTELLVLCNTLISQNARFLKQVPSRRKSQAKGDAIVQIKRQLVTETDHYATNSFRFVAFGLDLFNTALRRNRFDFRDPDVLARLDAMVVVVGNTLYSTSSPVLLLGLKSAAGIVKCPVKTLDKSLPVFVRQMIDIIKQAGNTESEIVQVAFKSLANILRDGPTVQVKETDLVYLLELLSPDIEEPTRQASVFTMLRAIVSRKFIVPEIYDIMDKVSEILVTSQSPQVQELCRGVLLQFLLDYPQGKGRLRNQMTFLAKNLTYVHESGRISVMELLSAITTKFDVKLIREYGDLLFVALVMVVANDDSAKCREMAALLIKSLFGRLDEEHRKVVLSHLHSWACQNSQPQLARVSSQVYGFIVDASQADSLPYISTILQDLKSNLERSAQTLALLEDGTTEGDAIVPVDLEWQAPYYALTVLSKILRVFPNYAVDENQVAWNLVASHLLFPHAWVRTASCRLLGLLFTAVPVAAPSTNLPDHHPLSSVGMQDIAKKLCLQLKSEHLDDSLSLQVVKNLFYIGKCLHSIPVPGNAAEDDRPGDESEDDGNGDADTENPSNPLPWLFSKLSYQVKSAHIARRNRTFAATNWAQQPLSVLRWFAAMTSHMDAEEVEKFLVHILTPVYRLIEDDTIREAQMDELKTVATELQELVQTKVGTTKFSTVYNQIRQSTLGIRRERKAAKVMQVTTNPEAAAKRKLQRNVIKKESRKRKDRGFADGKGKIKRRREE